MIHEIENISILLVLQENTGILFLQDIYLVKRIQVFLFELFLGTCKIYDI